MLYMLFNPKAAIPAWFHAGSVVCLSCEESLCGMFHSQSVALGCHCGSCKCLLQAGKNTEWLEHKDKGVLGFYDFKGLWFEGFF